MGILGSWFGLFSTLPYLVVKFDLQNPAKHSNLTKTNKEYIKSISINSFIKFVIYLSKISFFLLYSYFSLKMSGYQIICQTFSLGYIITHYTQIWWEDCQKYVGYYSIGALGPIWCSIYSFSVNIIFHNQQIHNKYWFW